MLLLSLSAALAVEPTFPPTLLQVQLGHTFSIHDVAWSPDGAIVATAGNDETVRVWDVATGRLLRMFATAEAPAVAFSGARALVIADNWEIRTVDLTDGQEITTQEGGGPAMVAPDGRMAAYAQASPEHISEAGYYTCHMFYTLDVAGELHDPPLLSGEDALCPSLLDSALAGGTLVGTDTTTTRVRPANAGGRGPYDLPGSSTVALTPDGSRLVMATGGQGMLQPDLTVWDLATGLRTKRLRKVNPQGVDHLAVSPDGTHALVSDGANHLRWFDLAKRKPIWTLDYPSSVIAISPSGKQALLGHRGDDDHDVEISDLESGKITRTFAGRTPAAASVGFAPGRVMVGGSDGSLAVWSLETLGLERTIAASYYPVLGIDVSPDGRRAAVVTAEPDAGIGEPPTVWDLATGQKLSTIGDVLAHEAIWLADGTLLAGTRSGSLILADASGVVQRTIEGFGPVNGLARSADGKRVAGCVGDLTVWEAGSYDVPAWSTPFGPAICRAVAWSPDGARIAVSGSGDREYDGELAEWVEVWEVGSDSPSSRIDFDAYENGAALDVAFFDDSQLLTTNEDGGVRLWDLETDGEIAATAHFGPVSDVAVQDGLIASAGLSDAARLWRPGGSEVQLASDARGEWVIFGANGWFDASTNGGDLVAVVQGADVWGIDQFATQMNRPDLLLAGLELGTPELRDHWKARYERRLKKLGVAARGLEDPGDVPTVRITHAEGDGVAGHLKLRFEAVDPGDDLVRYDLFVNDVPVYAGGKPLTGREAIVSETVQLLQGDNVVEVSVVNAAGVESRRAMRSFARATTVVGGGAPPKTPSDLWFVGFGVSDYADPRLQDLQFADDDAVDLGKLFAALPGYGQIHTRVLVDAEVTPDAIDAARAFLAEADVDDTIVVFVAGHGLHDDDPAATYYFLTHGADLDRLSETAASFERVEALLQGVAPRKKLLLLDTCESGEAEDAVAVVETGGAHGVARGVRVTSAAAPSNASPAAPRPWLYARDRFVYNDLSRRTGAIVFSSARGGEYAYESAQLGHGYFTAAILDGVGRHAADADGDGVVSVDELRAYVSRAVAERSADHQHPVVDRDNLKAKFGFAVPPPSDPAR